MNTKKFKWWHAAIILVVANLISAAPAGFNGEEAFYNNHKLPALAPPDWLFAPVWLFNNITSLIALYIIANMPKETPYRRAFINSEISAWVLFSIFSILYFGMKSTVLAAIDTSLGLLFAGASLYFSYKIDRKAFWNIMPRFIWLALATYVSVYVAVENKDEFLSLISR